MNRISRTLAVTASLAALGFAVPAAATASAPASDRASAPSCNPNQVKVGFNTTGHAAGHVFGQIRVTNLSRTACNVGGFGGISYVGHGDGTQIGHAATRLFPNRTRTVVLHKGQTASTPLEMTRAKVYSRRECRPRKVDGFRVYVPNATRSKFIAHKTLGCANMKIKLITHKSYRRVG